MEKVEQLTPETEPKQRAGGIGCLGCVFGEFLVILVLIGLVSILAMLTLGGGWDRLLMELPASPVP